MSEVEDLRAEVLELRDEVAALRDWATRASAYIQETPRTEVLSKSFWRRAFAVYGHYLAASMALSAAVLAVLAVLGAVGAVLSAAGSGLSP